MIEWLSDEHIIDTMDTFFKSFDDSSHNPAWFNSQIWFHRKMKTPCPPCGRDYLPHHDRQHYCYNCEKWIHISCLDSGEGDLLYLDFNLQLNQESLNIQKLGEDGLPLIFNEVLSKLTVRGHGGQFSFEDSWLYTGSEVQKDSTLISKIHPQNLN